MGRPEGLRDGGGPGAPQRRRLSLLPPAPGAARPRPLRLRPRRARGSLSAMMDPLGAVREGLGWVHVLVTLAGLVVCVVHASRSRWIWVMALGFAGEAAVSVS